jgi:hypothetical protein
MELNPDPVKVNTVWIVPEGGVTTTLVVTLKSAPMGGPGTSFAGVPLTVTFHLTFVVANGPTTKLPVATVGVTIEQVGAVIKMLFGAAWTMHAGSDAENPVPLKVTVPPLVAFAGKRINVAA